MVSLEDKLEFAKQIVLRTVFISMMTMISKDWADDLVTQMDQQVQNDLVEKSNIATQKISFAGEGFVPNFQDPFGW